MAGVEAWFSNSPRPVHSASACTAIGESVPCRLFCPMVSASKPAASRLVESLWCALSRLSVESRGVGKVEIAVSDVWGRACRLSAMEQSSSASLPDPRLVESRVSCSCAPLRVCNATKKVCRRERICARRVASALVVIYTESAFDCS